MRFSKSFTPACPVPNNAVAKLSLTVGVTAIEQGSTMEAATVRARQETVGRQAAGSPLLRLNSDERLVAMTRRGQDGAFEALVSRYQTRLLGFCRNMLGNHEDAEDVLQEVFASAYTAMLADDREIMVRPWLYRIARNRSLNHMRRARPVGVDSMDVHVADFGTSTAERVQARTEFRQVMADIALLPETQRTALVLREVDGLGYEQIAEAMETTVPSVKSLLVRARVALAEHAEARGLTCDNVRMELGEVAEGIKRRISPAVRRHMKSCDHCKDFKAQLTASDKALAAMAPVGLLFAAKQFLVAQLGISGTAGGSAATVGSAGTGASAATGISGSITATLGVVATKAAAGVAAAALVTAGAVEVGNSTHSHAVTPPAASGAAMAIPAVVEDVTNRKASAAAKATPAAAPLVPALAAIAAAAQGAQDQAAGSVTPAAPLVDVVQTEDTIVLPGGNDPAASSGQTANGSSVDTAVPTGGQTNGANANDTPSNAGNTADTPTDHTQVSPDAPAAAAPADQAATPTAG